MGGTAACILAAVVVLIVLIVAVLAYRRGRRESIPFMPGDPATPKLRSAVLMLRGDLACIAHVADSIEQRGFKLDAANATSGPAAEAHQSLSGARRGMAEIVSGVKSLRATLETMPPTYHNVLGLYRGLRDGDQALWDAAKSLDAAGARMGELVGRDAPQGGELAAAGRQLRQMASCLYSLVRSTHLLGDALGLE